MTFLSYVLPKGAPQKMVWFAECDACRSRHLGPFPNAPKPDQRETVEGAGWRYQVEHPMDTCPACLDAEKSDAWARLTALPVDVERHLQNVKEMT